jgi:hypothetical protein
LSSSRCSSSPSPPQITLLFFGARCRRRRSRCRRPTTLQLHVPSPPPPSPLLIPLFLSLIPSLLGLALLFFFHLLF